jgi:dTDP-4-amino-4,6-dideoxygalactose transaminase
MPWDPPIGRPNRLTLRRFGREVGQLGDNVARRRRAAREIQGALENVPAIRFIRTEPGCQTPGFFLSFVVADGGFRNRLLTALHRKGFFLLYAWDTVPASFRCFRDMFPFGCSESTYLAERICHVPVIRYLRRSRRERLIENLIESLKHA